MPSSSNGSRQRESRLWRAIGAILAAIGAAALFSSNGDALAAGSYALGWQTVVSGGTVRSRNPCYRLSGAIAQATVTPGVISNPSGAQYMLFSGFWSAAPTVGQDQIFFNGFEDCKP
ncbi:MAG: hypothetical protein JSS28_06695 [Proteobacteria bacterium]|nr:hypothetical protein [Pseudomonadota bacterium]